MSEETAPKRHFSMLRDFHLADLFTIANGGCGIVAIFSAMSFHASGSKNSLYLALVLIPLALIFDVLDGRIARWRRKASPLGRELDSLADLISFGVAPATIAFSVGLNGPLDQLGLAFFVLCGLSRLARYNITAEELSTGGKVRYFEGAPIPTSVVPLLAIAFAWRFDAIGAAGASFHLWTLLFVISGSLMVSKTLHIPKP